MKKETSLTVRRKEVLCDEGKEIDCMPDLPRAPGGVRFFEQDDRSGIEKR
jgi:hypothetical protein